MQSASSSLDHLHNLFSKHMFQAIDTLKKGPTDDPNSTTTDQVTRRKTRIGNRVSVFMSG